MQHSQRVLLAKPRTAPMARRREPGGPAAKHRALAPCRTRGGTRPSRTSAREAVRTGRQATEAVSTARAYEGARDYGARAVRMRRGAKRGGAGGMARSG